MLLRNKAVRVRVRVKTLQDSKNPLKTQCFQGIKLVREAGLEPARPEWTLEPELDLDRYGMCRIVSPSTPQTVENTSFFELFARKSSTRARCKKSTVRWMFVGCFYRRHPRKEF